MNRKKFIQTSALASASFFITKDLLAKPKGPVYGHNDKKYYLDTKWGVLNTEKNTCQ